MKIVLPFIVLSMIFASSVSASELIGQISTNPNAPAGGQASPPEVPPAGGASGGAEAASASQAPAAANAGGAVILPPPIKPAGPVQPAQAGAPKPAVLGEKIYQDGSLLRGPDGKIYLISGQAKKYIAGLKELAKYRGREIISAAPEELAKYKTRNHVAGELIREKGEVKVYEITKSGKHHILNLEELRKHYFGLEINNISREEMRLY